MSSVVVTLAFLTGGLVIMVLARRAAKQSDAPWATWCLRGALLAGAVGLVGTVVMLVRAFEGLTEASADRKAELLASSISGAMTFTYAGITTALVLAAASLLFSRKKR